VPVPAAQVLRHGLRPIDLDVLADIGPGGGPEVADDGGPFGNRLGLEYGNPPGLFGVAADGTTEVEAALVVGGEVEALSPF
jgi:hypothetical protein